jgi:hypothetical protein
VLAGIMMSCRSAVLGGGQLGMRRERECSVRPSIGALSPARPDEGLHSLCLPPNGDSLDALLQVRATAVQTSLQQRDTNSRLAGQVSIHSSGVGVVRTSSMLMFAIAVN